MSPKTRTQKPTKSTGKASNRFTAEERAAMRERAREVKRQREEADGESDVLAKVVGTREPAGATA